MADAQGAYLFRQVAAGVGYSVVAGGDAVGGSRCRPHRQPRQLVLRAIDLAPAAGRATLHLHPDPGRHHAQRQHRVPDRRVDPGRGRWSSTTRATTPRPRPARRQESPCSRSRATCRRRQHAGHRLLGRRVRLSSRCSSPSTATTWSRPSPASRGRTATSAWSASPTPGISQLFVGPDQPAAACDAITPLSVFADSYRGIGYPGGILNNGFSLNWVQDRDGRRPSRRRRGGPTTASQRRHHVRRQPAPTAPEHRSAPGDARPVLREPRRLPVAPDLRRPDQRAHLPRRARSRTSRPAGTGPR